MSQYQQIFYNYLNEIISMIGSEPIPSDSQCATGTLNNIKIDQSCQGETTFSGNYGNTTTDGYYGTYSATIQSIQNLFDFKFNTPSSLPSTSLNKSIQIYATFNSSLNVSGTANGSDEAYIPQYSIPCPDPCSDCLNCDPFENNFCCGTCSCCYNTSSENIPSTYNSQLMIPYATSFNAYGYGCAFSGIFNFSVSTEPVSGNIKTINKNINSEYVTTPFYIYNISISLLELSCTNVTINIPDVSYPIEVDQDNVDKFTSYISTYLEKNFNKAFSDVVLEFS